MYLSYVMLCISGGLSRGSSGAALAIGLLGAGIAASLLFACWLALVSLMREYGFPGDLRLFTSRDERQTGVRLVHSYRHI